jgi:hypothetical protein
MRVCLINKLQIDDFRLQIDHRFGAERPNLQSAIYNLQLR